MSRILIFGLGYTADRLARRLNDGGWHVDATGKAGNLDFANDGGVSSALSSATHILSSVPPADGSDPVLDRYGAMFKTQWTGYLSSTGVYGDAQGAWVDESAPTGSGRRKDRSICDAAWKERSAHIFRLPGIYGPGRSALDRVQSGQARRIDSAGQVFSRIHVDDIVSGVMAGFDGPPGAYNLADDLPCSQNAVIEEACQLLGKPMPPLQTLEDADLSPMARGFYAENRRVANGKAKRVLGWRPRYKDYRAGLRALV